MPTATPASQLHDGYCLPFTRDQFVVLSFATDIATETARRIRFKVTDMDKSLCFVAVVAFSCVGLSTASAQLELMDGNQRPVRLIAQQSDDQVGDSQLGNADGDRIPNPFDLFTGQDFDAPIPSIPSAAPENGPGLNDPSASSANPAGLPIAKQGPSIVDTILDQSTVASVPHTGYAAVNWTAGHAHPHNPVARVLLREDCPTAALWAGYPAQRAAECAQMWNHLNRQQQRGCGSCGTGQGGSCGQGGCGRGGCGTGAAGCSTCNQPVVHNRYQHAVAPAAPCAACDSHAATASVRTGVPTAAPALSTGFRDVTPPPPAESGIGPATGPGNGQAMSSTGKVAAFPTVTR